MIDLKSVSMSFLTEERTVQVLSDVNVTIEQGETVAITGPSGSGKTTLLLLLAGLEFPVTGDILLDRKSLPEMDTDQLADLRRDELGIVFQSFHLVPSLTALSNVSLPLEIAGKTNAKAQAKQMLDKVGLADRALHFPMQLSGGEQQRVAIARALVHSPKLVLADEPTGNLDHNTGSSISNLLFKLNEEAGSTLIVVTHSETLANRCQRILRLQQGRLIEDNVSVFPG